MQEYFISKDVKYGLRARDLLQVPAAKSITLGIDSIKFGVGFLCNSVPGLIKRPTSAAIRSHFCNVELGKKSNQNK